MRRDTVAQPRWRIQLIRPDGSVWKEAIYDSSRSAWDAFRTLADLSTEHVVLQYRAAGSNRYVDLDRRGA